MNAKRAFEWQMVFWSLYFVLFVGAWWLTVGRLKLFVLARDAGPASSSDVYFFEGMGLEDGTRTVDRCLAALPPASKVAVAYRIGTYQTLPGQLTCLGIWRHGHTAVEISADRKEAFGELVAKRPAAIFWLDGNAPAWLPEVKAFSDTFSFGPCVIRKP